MVNLRNIWAVVRMERRHTRRLLRYWVFLFIAYVIGLGAYFYYGILHALFSSISASVGMIGPRYLMGAVALYYLTGFVLGIVFLGFDVRARDIREGIVEVLDARPLTNFELVAGRFVALFLSAWIPILILALLIQGFGVLLPLLDSPVGRTVEPLSLVNFVVAMAVPAIAFAIALVFLITLLVRHRLIAALLSIAVIVAMYWAMLTVPAPYLPLVDFMGVSQAGSPSDIVPAAIVAGGWWQRLGFLALAFGLVGMAAAIHPRLDGLERLRPAAGSAALVLVGIVAVGLVAQQRFGDAAEVARWRSAHAARAGEPAPDIVSIAGSLDIEPGRSLAADLSLELRAPSDRPLSRILLTLNPGFVIGEVRSADGNTLAAEEVDGLLDIELDRALDPGEATSLTLRYSGRPDLRFGYLDSAIPTETLNMNEAQIALLGFDRGVFDRRYVALTPGIRWLPASGVDVGRDDPRTRRTDFFDVSLDVELPASWLAAGPGKRQVLSSSDDGVAFRFAPRTSVPEVALMAGELVSYSTEIDGITFEMLVHPGHTENFEVLAGARAEVEQWIADRLEVAEQAGLAYPFDAFTAVEVPNSVRGFEGGWRLDTALAPPAMMLVRETSFPTARFDFDFLKVFGNRAADPEGGEARVMRDRLVSFFSNDFSGGNLFTGAARSFFVHRTTAFGPDAIALDFTLEELATLLVSGQRSYFSAHLFKNINAAAVTVANGLGQGRSVAESMIDARTAQPDVWTAALDAPLSRIDPWEDPQRTIDVLTLRGGEMAQAVYDTLGPEAVGALLAHLLERHAGGTYTLADVVAAGERVDRNLGPLFEDWIGSTGMPGFIADAAEVYRLPENDNGDSRYQLLVRVTNGEPVVGFMRVAWTMERGGERTFSEPIRVAASSTVEYGVVLSEPPAVAYVHPYLSLNRGDFMAGILNAAEVRSRSVAPLDGVREVSVGAGDRIVADDLDERFSIAGDPAASDLRLAGRNEPAAGVDAGLPIAIGAQPPRAWSRRVNETAWGRYRHTFAFVGAGDGARRAVMPASIPSPGRWELEIHVPFMQILPAEARGTWNLEIVSDDGREPVSYDARVAETGWNLVGQYELPAGEVRVDLTDRTDGRMVVADAVAWSPVRVQTQSNETQSSETESR